jgi:hypothetical protein
VVTSVFKTTGAVAAAAIDWAVVTHVAYVGSANNAKEKAADSATNRVANRRSVLIVVSP